MEYGHNLAKDGTSSVKIHHQPGGASSFSLGLINMKTGDSNYQSNSSAKTPIKNEEHKQLAGDIDMLRIQPTPPRNSVIQPQEDKKPDLSEMSRGLGTAALGLGLSKPGQAKKPSLA